MTPLIPDEDKNFGASFVLDFRKARAVKDRERSRSHRKSDTSEQNITTNLSHRNPREKGRRLDGATCSCCSWRNAFW